MRSQTPIFNDLEFNLKKDFVWIDILIFCNQLYILKRKIRFEGHLKGQGHQNYIFFFEKFSETCGWLDAGTQTDAVLGLSYSGNLRPNVKA